MEKTKLYLNGEWVSAKRTYDLYSPYTRGKIAEVALANESDVKAALIGAHNAFKEIKDMPSYKRAEILYNVVALLKERKEEAASIIALEAAKPIKTARTEIDRTIATYQFAAEEAKRIYGETIPMDAAPGGEQHIGFTWREPLGVGVAISPFNLVAHKLGPAIAAGNTIVLKPAEQTPLSALFIAKLFEEAGLPPGALQVITGDGRELSHALTTDPLIKKISFTGSATVGKIIKKQAGLTKMTLELGSNFLDSQHFTYSNRVINKFPINCCIRYIRYKIYIRCIRHNSSPL